MTKQKKNNLFVYPVKVFYFLVKNLIQRISAVLIAVIIWIVVGNQNPLNNIEFQLATSVSYVNVPNNLVITNELIEQINIKIKAQRRDTNKIKASNFQIILDLKNIKEGKNNFTIAAGDIQSSINFKLISLTPHTLIIDADRVAEKSINIRVIVAGLHETNKVIKKLQNTPSSVLVKGPISFIKDLEYIETLPVDIDINQQEQDFVIGLNIPKNLSIPEGIENISGRIILGEKAKSVLFDKVPVSPIRSSFEVRSNPKTINILLSGPSEIIDNINKNKLKAYINLLDYQPGKYNFKKFDLNLPSEVIIKKSWPPVDVWILTNKKKL